MATRRVIKGVLENFLGTYVSRYSDYDGYRLFGFLVNDLGELRINLLGERVSEPDTPMGVAVLSAVSKFEDQCDKAGLVPSQVRDAWLMIRRLSGLDWGSVNGHWCAGFNLGFSVVAITDDAKRYERNRVEFVAPHNPVVELRSTRAAERGR
jgi:hypothetical protein